jgi:sugar-specific transcriptional regulator TrmB
MHAAELVTTLENVGIPQKAAAIYLTLLSANRLHASEIAKMTGIKRATCYEYLEILLQRDFITRVPIGRRTYYAAADPKKILHDVRQKAATLEARLGDLRRMRDSAVNRPKVSFYEGKREIKNIYHDLFATVGDVYSIFPADSFFESFSEDDYREFDKALSDHALRCRDLFVVSRHYKKLRTIRHQNGAENKAEKRLPAEFRSNVDVIIYNEKVALISLRDLSAVVIENKNIADLFRNMHDFMWRTL